MANKPTLEVSYQIEKFSKILIFLKILQTLVLKVTEHSSERKQEESTPASGAVNSVPATVNNAQVKVNKTIQMLAQQYCNECKTSFEELSKIIQRVLVSRKELISYDSKHKDMEPPQVMVKELFVQI